MAKNLVIVESPAKSKTIKKILWPDFEVKASFGHVVDLPTKWMWIDIEHDFKPLYEVSPDKKKVVSELKKLAKESEKVWLATDEDREWEAIGWHVANQLWLPVESTARIVFHEITEKAIKHAVQNPRTLDMKLVDAQQARRVLDRLVWFELSPVLWKKVAKWLSAWRVQSVAVRLIVEREREIENFNSSSTFKTVGTFIWDAKKDFPATLDKEFKKEWEVTEFLENCKTADFIVSDIETKPGKKTPSAPFTTSTLQQEASRKLWFPVAKTMQLAQKLYEAWKITYMRTDSVNLSQDAINAAKVEITKEYGEKYSNPINYKTKSSWAQEAHECIRPAHLEIRKAWEDPAQKKLYDLIWKRTIASQMAPAVVEKTKVTIDISNNKNKFIAEWEVIKFDWFLKVYSEWTDDDEESMSVLLPDLQKWEKLDSIQISSTQKFKKHAPRYTEASLVKELEKRWIGRPSTYAPTISTIQKRWYVELDSRTWEKIPYTEFLLKNNEITQSTKTQNSWAEKNKLFPTDTWRTVTDFLMDNFNDILDYNFTANVEEEFDKIAEWDIQRVAMISKFYGPFHEEVSKAQWAERASGERVLWEDPKTWKPVIVRLGRYGPLIQIWKADDEDKKFANIPNGKTIETITLEEALDCFGLPREVWEYEWEKVIAAIWRFWPYLKYKDLFVSIPKWWEDPLDPYTITIEQSIPLIQQKIEKENNKYIHEYDYKWKKIEVLNWMYWPYIKYDKKNYRIPKWWKDATDLTLEDCLDIMKIK